MNLSKVFDQIDTDKSGDISYGELRSLMEYLGIHPADFSSEMEDDAVDAAVKELFDTMDANKDGRIVLAEWEKTVPKRVKQALSAKLNTKVFHFWNHVFHNF